MTNAVTIYQPRSPIPLERQIARRIDQDVPFYLLKDEIERMIALTEKLRDKMLLATMWSTGGRISEVVQIRRSDFDLHHIKLVNLKQAHYSEKLVYVAPSYALQLVDYCERQKIGPTDYLFQAKKSKRPISARMARNIFYDAARRAGIVKVKDGQEVLPWPHLTRHGACVQLIRGGTPLKIVRQQMGHASLLTTERYMMFSQEDCKHFINQAMG